ncbi:hypothetical protein DES53_108281 [Roseimicrobium gellanilyticum]|uniref:Uncharacterized protein n=1 Tax=Roseimicrobium gellanilyticum TaxID=748857 RepID=A0A366HFX2_9BACT|nr:hypothetical protein DES53_108281 [Roseimicrobium gellanilyticum]
MRRRSRFLITHHAPAARASTLPSALSASCASRRGYFDAHRAIPSPKPFKPLRPLPLCPFAVNQKWPCSVMSECNARLQLCAPHRTPQFPKPPQHQKRERRHANHHQHHTQRCCRRQRNANTCRERHVARYTRRALRHESQQGRGHEPSHDLATTTPSRRRPRRRPASLLAGARLVLARGTAGARAHARASSLDFFALPLAQPQPPFATSSGEDTGQ